MNTNTRQEIVSIITPVYNAENFIADTIKTVQEQYYTNWELILINDRSEDRSLDIIKKYQKDDKRIKLINLKENSGAAVARNTGVYAAKGKFIAFLDADDIWAPNKIKKQISFMSKGSYAFTYTGYEFADSLGRPTGKVVDVPGKINYEQSLKNPIIWTSTVMIDLDKVEKELALMPNIRRGQDAATWWNILRRTQFTAHGIKSPLAYYRRTGSSLSANKLKAIKRTWYLYRNIERLSLIKSVYVFSFYAYNAVRKRV